MSIVGISSRKLDALASLCLALDLWAKSMEAYRVPICSGVQEWQQHETDRSELEQRLHALRGEKKQAAKHLDECLGRASVTQSNQAGIVGSLSFSAVQATASRTTYLGNVRAILTRALVPSGTQADKGSLFLLEMRCRRHCA